MRSGRRHLGLLAILAVHATLFAAIVGSASPWATAPLECAAGSMASMAVDGGSAWSLWDSFHGALGGMAVSATFGAPLFALFGVQPAVVKLLAWLAAAVGIGVVYFLLDRHESRTSALLGAAGIAFAPPTLFHVQAVFGNWHWTQLIFDYGIVLFALELARRPRPPWAWGLFGLTTGLGIFNCIASIPFMAVGWGALLLSNGADRRWGAAVSGTVLGSTPFLYKLLLHRPFGLETQPDQTVGRLSRLQVDPGKALDLVYPELPWALHVHDVLPTWSPDVTWNLATAWVVVCWTGLGAAGWLGARRWRRLWKAGAEDRRRLPVALVPALFALLFAGAYVVLQVKLRILPVEFTNVREAAHRATPPLLAALVIGSAIGWSRLADLRPRYGLAFLVTAAAPAAIGALTMVAMIQRDAPPGVATVDSYRAVCFDAQGHFSAGAWRDDPGAGMNACAGVSTAFEPAGAAEAAARRCRTGIAWGVGFFGGQLGSVPADRAPAGWDGTQIGFTAAGLDACDAVVAHDPGMLAACRLGQGWVAGASNWGEPTWPLRACDSFADPADRELCWRGVGFPVGDHLHPSPDRVAALLGRVPDARRGLVAEGVGIGLARAYGTRAMGDWLCGRIGGRDAPACRVGVASWHDGAQ